MQTCKGKCNLYFKTKPLPEYWLGDSNCSVCKCAFSNFPPETILCPCCGCKLRWKSPERTNAQQQELIARMQQKAIEMAKRECTLCGSNKTTIAKDSRTGKPYPVWRNLTTFIKSDRTWRRNINTWLCGNCYETAYALRKLSHEKLIELVRQRRLQLERILKLATILDGIETPALPA